MMSNQNKYAAAAKKAQDKTDETFKNRIASITRLKEEEIDRLFPKRSDKEDLLELIAMVKQETSDNEKIVIFKDNAEKFGAIALRLVSLLV